MSARRSNAPMLAGAAGLLAVVVVGDRLGWFAGGARADEAGAQGGYVAALAAYEDEASVIRARGDWAATAERARAGWARVGAGLVRGATVELAETRFREAALGAMSDIPLISPARVSYVRDGAAATGLGVRALKLTVAFDAPTPRDAYTIIDRLEHLPDVRARIESLRIEGPGRMQAAEQVSVMLTLSSAAWIGSEEAAP